MLSPLGARGSVTIVGNMITIKRTKEKKNPRKTVQNQYEKWSKEVNSDNFCYCKVERAISKFGAKEKLPILLSQYKKKIFF